MDDGIDIALCVVEELDDGPGGPGFYYSLADEDGNETDPLGPFDTDEEAEAAFLAAMQDAVIEIVKKTLGLED